MQDRQPQGALDVDKGLELCELLDGRGKQLAALEIARRGVYQPTGCVATLERVQAATQRHVRRCHGRGEAILRAAQAMVDGS